MFYHEILGGGKLVTGWWSFPFSVYDVIPTNVQQHMSSLVFFAFFPNFMEKAPPIIKFYGVFNHFSQPHEVAKSWTIKLYHCISDIIHTNEQNMLIVATCKNMELFVYVQALF